MKYYAYTGIIKWNKRNKGCSVIFLSFQFFIKTVNTTIFMKIQLKGQKDINSNKTKGLCCFVSCQSRVQDAIWMSRVVIFKTHQLHWFVVIKAMSPQLLCLQDFIDQLSRLSGNENDQWRLVYWLSYAVIRMMCLQFYNLRWSNANSLQVGGKSLENLEE